MQSSSEVLRDLHTVCGWTVIIGNAVAGAWALGAHRFEPLRVKALWWLVIAAEGAIFIQAGLGVAILQDEDLEPPDFHLLYGFSLIVAVGILYSYRTSSPWVRARVHLVYGLGSLFMTGLAIRGFQVRGSL